MALFIFNKAVSLKENGIMIKCTDMESFTIQVGN
jgi:hypothetical protein